LTASSKELLSVMFPGSMIKKTHNNYTIKKTHNK